MFWKWGGKNIKIYGNGVLNGNGQRWWNEFAGKEILDKTNQYLRPILFYAENATGLDIQGIHFKDSPCWTNFVVTCEYFPHSTRNIKFTHRQPRISLSRMLSVQLTPTTPLLCPRTPTFSIL